MHKRQTFPASAPNRTALPPLHRPLLDLDHLEQQRRAASIWGDVVKVCGRRSFVLADKGAGVGWGLNRDRQQFCGALSRYVL